jgi:hypothetical protein
MTEETTLIMQWKTWYGIINSGYTLNQVTFQSVAKHLTSEVPYFLEQPEQFFWEKR